MKQMTAMAALLLPAFALAALVAACAPPPPAGQATATPTPAMTSATATERPGAEVTASATLEKVPAGEAAIMEKLDEEGRQLLTQARDDLAGRLNVRPDQIKSVSAEPLMWPDTSLGCPQPGMMYAQVVTPGYRILLEHEGREYDYHAGRGRVLLCEKK